MNITSWQRLLLKAAGFGAGFAALLVGTFAIWFFVESLPKTPKPWNRDVIKVTYVDLSVKTGERPVATFRYTIENTTPSDYYLPTDAKSAFVLLPKGKGLSQEEDLTWDKGAYVPAGQKVAFSFQITYDYDDSYPEADRDNLHKLATFMNRKLEELDGFAVLDRTNRYQISFPKGWQNLPTDSKDKVLPNSPVGNAPKGGARPSP